VHAAPRPASTASASMRARRHNVYCTRAVRMHVLLHTQRRDHRSTARLRRPGQRLRARSRPPVEHGPHRRAGNCQRTNQRSTACACWNAVHAPALAAERRRSANAQAVCSAADYVHVIGASMRQRLYRLSHLPLQLSDLHLQHRLQLQPLRRTPSTSPPSPSASRPASRGRCRWPRTWSRAPALTST
jgi:hypothetical protein